MLTGPVGRTEAEVIAHRFIEDDAAAVVLAVRRWFETWALDFYRELISGLGGDEIVTEGSLNLVVEDPSAETVARAIQAVDRQWRFALGLAAGRWDTPPVDITEPSLPRDLRAVLSESMVSPREFGLTLAYAEAGSFKSTWKKSGVRKFLLSQELAAVLSLLSFAGISGPAIVQHFRVHGSDGSKCELNITAVDLPASERDRVLREAAHLPDGCTIKIELKTASGQTASMLFPESFPPPSKRTSYHF